MKKFTTHFHTYASFSCLNFIITLNHLVCAVYVTVTFLHFQSTASDSGHVEKLPTISEQIRKLHGVPIFPPTKPQVWQIGGGMYMSESTDTGLDRIDMQRPAEPLEPVSQHSHLKCYNQETSCCIVTWSSLASAVLGDHI